MKSQEIILLNALSDSYKEVKAAIKFGRKTITLDEVILALRSWDLEMKTVTKGNGNGESLNVRGRPNNRNFGKGRGKSISKSKNLGEKWWKSVKCYNCQEIGHTKRFCPKKSKEGKDKEATRRQATVVEDGYGGAEVLVVSTGEADKR